MRENTEAMDKVVFPVVEEANIKSETGKIKVVVQTRSTKPEGEILKSIADLDWTIGDVEQYSRLGAERKLVAFARVPTKDVLETVSRIQRFSQEDSHALCEVSYDPSKKQLDEVYKQLRARIYELAVEEAKVLSSTVTEAGPLWRVHSITFQESSRGAHILRNTVQTTTRGTDEDSSDGVVSKVALYGTVELARTPVEKAS